MGLDMMLYRLNKPSEITPMMHVPLERKKTLEEFGISFIGEEEVPLHCKTFMDNAVEMTTDDEYWDIPTILMKLCEESKIEYDAEMEYGVCMTSSSEKGVTFSYSSYNTFIPRDEIPLYIIHKKTKLYAVKMEEVAYQRKGLSDRGWELMACDNCDFTDDYDKVKAMVDEGGLSDRFLDNWEEGHTVFHPWW